MSGTLQRSGITLLLAFALAAGLALPASGGGVTGTSAFICVGAEAWVGALQPWDTHDDGTKKYEKNQGAGLYLLGFGPPRTFSWTIATDAFGCTFFGDDGTNLIPVFDGTLSANGLATGWAGIAYGAIFIPDPPIVGVPFPVFHWVGPSIGSSGKGRFETTGEKQSEVNLHDIWWVSPGTVLFVRFKHDYLVAKGDIGPIDNHTLRGLGNGQALIWGRDRQLPSSCDDHKHTDPGSPLDNPKDGPKTGLRWCSTVEIVGVLL